MKKLMAVRGSRHNSLIGPEGNIFRATCTNEDCEWTEKAGTDKETRERALRHARGGK